MGEWVSFCCSLSLSLSHTHTHHGLLNNSTTRRGLSLDAMALNMRSRARQAAPAVRVVVWPACCYYFLLLLLLLPSPPPPPPTLSLPLPLRCYSPSGLVANGRQGAVSASIRIHSRRQASARACVFWKTHWTQWTQVTNECMATTGRF